LVEKNVRYFVLNKMIGKVPMVVLALSLYIFPPGTAVDLHRIREHGHGRQKTKLD